MATILAPQFGREVLRCNHCDLVQFPSSNQLCRRCRQPYDCECLIQADPTQIGVHAVTPLHMLLFLPFIEFGVYLFHSSRLPLSHKQIEHSGHHPWRLLRDTWQWE
jgi:hypothetical protein